MHEFYLIFQTAKNFPHQNTELQKEAFLTTLIQNVTYVDKNWNFERSVWIWVSVSQLKQWISLKLSIVNVEWGCSLENAVKYSLCHACVPKKSDGESKFMKNF